MVDILVLERWVGFLLRSVPRFPMPPSCLVAGIKSAQPELVPTSQSLPPDIGQMLNNLWTHLHDELARKPEKFFNLYENKCINLK